jgi:hypothetical protein
MNDTTKSAFFEELRIALSEVELILADHGFDLDECAEDLLSCTDDDEVLEILNSVQAIRTVIEE